jgi:hypothetical protein
LKVSYTETLRCGNPLPLEMLYGAGMFEEHCFSLL